MEHTFLIDNCVLVLERKKIKFKKKQKISYQPNSKLRCVQCKDLGIISADFSKKKNLNCAQKSDKI